MKPHTICLMYHPADYEKAFFNQKGTLVVVLMKIAACAATTFASSALFLFLLQDSRLRSSADGLLECISLLGEHTVVNDPTLSLRNCSVGPQNLRH